MKKPASFVMKSVFAELPQDKPASSPRWPGGGGRRGNYADVRHDTHIDTLLIFLIDVNIFNIKPQSVKHFSDALIPWIDEAAGVAFRFLPSHEEVEVEETTIRPHRPRR